MDWGQSMEDNRWKQAFGDIALAEDDKEELWDQLERRITRHPGRRHVLRAAAVAAIVIAGIGTTLMIDGMTGGRLVNALTGIWKTEKGTQEIVRTVTDYYYIGLDSVYAPEVIECSDTRIVFANSFGLVVYDRKREQVVGTIDLQKIQCNYFNADTLQTRFLLMGDQLTVYNLSKKKVSGKYYVFDLSHCTDREDGTIALETVETGPASGQLEKKWKEQAESRISTWEDHSRKEELRDKMYSEYSIQWETGEHIRYRSYLVVEGTEVTGAPTEKKHQLMMYHRCLDTNKTTKERLNIHVDKTGEYGVAAEEGLPAYQYQGKDPVRKALSDCFASDLSRYEGRRRNWKGEEVKIEPDREDLEKRDLSVPLIDIVDIKKGKKYTKVCGTFRWASYSLSGNTLYEAGEGGSIGVAYLQETAEGYKVKKILHPRDGGLYAEDLKEFCGGNEKLVSKMLECDPGKLARNVLKEYVKQNELDIRYVKQFGWDPEKIW